MNTNTQPLWHLRLGSIQATAWNNEIRLEGGRSFEKTSVQFERRYKDKTGAWAGAKSYDLNDLLRLQVVARQAIDRMAGDGATSDSGGGDAQ